MDSFSFGDNPAQADSLLELMLTGKKKATTWAAIHGSENSKVGVQQIVKDGQERPRVVIEITELERKPFTAIDAEFAKDEGEGDLSLEYWRSEHERYFTNEGTFSPDMEVYCARFKVVKIL